MKISSILGGVQCREKTVKRNGLTKVTSINVDKVISFLRDSGVVNIDHASRQHIEKFQESIMRSAYTGTTKRGILLSVAPIMARKFHKHITSYAFRHSSATHWMDSAAQQKKDVLPFIQRQLGHESLESTALYTRVAIESLRQMFKLYHPRDIDQGLRAER